MYAQPLDDRLLVKRDPVIDKIGRFYVTGKAIPLVGTIVTCGPGKELTDGQRQPMDVQPGMRIMYTNHCLEDKLVFDEQEHIVIYEADIIGIIQTDAQIDTQATDVYC